MRTLSLIVAIAILCLSQPVSACTGIRLIANDGTVVAARTMELGLDLKSQVVVIPAGTELTGTLPNGAKGIRYTTKYGFIGANAFDQPVVVDGMNDQGLYVGEFFFTPEARYMDVTPQNASRAMAGYEYSNWILANFATVAELKAAYNSVVLAPTPRAEMGGMTPPLHFRVMDRTGATVVIEPLPGGLRIYDDSLGVITNTPAFDWHMTNLGNYVGLTPYLRPSVDIGGYTVNSLGQGSGFIGLPGDVSSPSRFVRAVAYQQTAIQPDSADDAVLQIFHILNNFDIPIGSVRQTIHGKEFDEFTSWTSAEDLKNLMFYFRTYHDQTLRSVDVRKALAAAGGKITSLPMESGRTTPIVPVGS
ncbi:MAG: choloylglycine hydrolase family protein [Candidatus Eremiobacteraeota bacterium]|nr:choloylglycine hydrolase family protein [Candidatus Eremiobacteraeota bacterium]